MKILVIFASFFASFSALAEPCSIVKANEKILLQNCAGVHVVTLQGSPAERAYLHGSLVGRELSADVVGYFSEKIFESAKSGLPRFLFEKGYHLWTWLYHRATPPELTEELNSLASGMRMKPIEVKRAILLPDTASFVNRLSSFSFLKSLPDVGCTSVVVKRGDNFIVGRNLDFASTTLWDAHPQITVQIPEPGSSELRHISIGSAGVQFAGITGLNEAGISFAVHQNYSTDASLGGVPMFLIGELVLRKARSLAEAETILRENRPGPLWTFVVTDLKKSEAIAVESSRHHFSVRKMSGKSFAQTNHVHSSSIKPWEYITVGTKKNSEFRYETALKMANAISVNSPLPEKIAAILAYQKNTEGEISSYNDILKAHTIQTAIFQRKGNEIELYLSLDPAPTSSGRYLRFSARHFWEKRGALPYTITDLTNTPPVKRKNQVNFAKSFAAYFDRHDDEQALAFVNSQTSLDAQLLKAVLLYRLAAKKPDNYELAIATSDRGLKASDKSDPAYILQSLRWVKLLSLHQLGQAQKAKLLSDQILAENPENPRLREIAARISKGKRLSKQQSRLGFEFFSGDISGHPN